MPWGHQKCSESLQMADISTNAIQVCWTMQINTHDIFLGYAGEAYITTDSRQIAYEMEEIWFLENYSIQNKRLLIGSLINKLYFKNAVPDFHQRRFRWNSNGS